MNPILVLMIILSFVIFSSPVFATYKIAIYTDQDSQDKSKGLVEYLKMTAPFNEFDIEFVIYPVTTTELNCGPTNGIDRLITCDTSVVRTHAFHHEVDQAFIVSNYPAYGGSGGSIPVITTDSNVPYSTMIHEYLHTLGFGDEYPYSTSESLHYCTPSNINRYINLALIEPFPHYAGDNEARRKHARQIPWYRLILKETAIASSVLGTPTEQNESLGLFKAKTCQNNSQNLFIWKPGNLISLMEKLDADLGILDRLVRKALISKGLKKKRVSINNSHAPEVFCGQTYETMPHTNKSIIEVYHHIMSLE